MCAHSMEVTAAGPSRALGTAFEGTLERPNYASQSTAVVKTSAFLVGPAGQAKVDAPERITSQSSWQGAVTLVTNPVSTDRTHGV